jgi:2-dehydro-3-deoxygluconokinase
MAEASGQVVSVGECMVELARGADGRYGLAFGGDTFNTAVYLARAGVPVAYATALGDDPYSGRIIDMARSENIATDLIAIAPGRMPGLYLIETSDKGERTFHYWRDRAPARDVFDTPHADTLRAAFADAHMIYFSGITLSLYSAAGLDRFADALAAARGAGRRIVMDGNYRPRGWGGDVGRARTIFERFWRLADIGLPTFEDEAMLWGDADLQATASRLAQLGVGEIAVKTGAEGALVSVGGQAQTVAVPDAVIPVDTTAAGDSFNAAYLAARLTGVDAPRAALLGHRLAGIVIQHRGAIAPMAATATNAWRA